MIVSIVSTMKGEGLNNLNDLRDYDREDLHLYICMYYYLVYYLHAFPVQKEEKVKDFGLKKVVPPPTFYSYIAKV